MKRIITGRKKVVTAPKAVKKTKTKEKGDSDGK